MQLYHFNLKYIVRYLINLTSSFWLKTCRCISTTTFCIKKPQAVWIYSFRFLKFLSQKYFVRFINFKVEMGLFLKISFIIILFFSHKALAQNIEVQNFIQDFGNKIISIASDKKSKDNQKKQHIIDLIDQNIDAKWIAKFVLGSHYKTATDNQKEQFFSLYRQFMINTYAPKFNGYNGKKFAVNNVSKQSSFFLVKAQFYPKDNQNPINLDKLSNINKYSKNK
jgi:ABC-type transporter MlaC component